MKFTFRNLPIPVKLGLLGVAMLAATAVAAFGGWHGLSRTHALQIRSTQTMAAFAQAVDTARLAQVDFKKQVQEWKDTLLRGNDPASFQKYQGAFAADFAKVSSDLALLKLQMSRLGLPTRQVDTALATHQELQTRYLAAIAQYNAKDKDAAHKVDTMVKGIDRAPTDAIDGIVATIKKASAAASVRVAAAENEAARKATTVLTLSTLGALVSGALIALLVAYSITVPIGRALRLALSVADGDLSVRVTDAGRDETGKLLRALDDMSEQLRRVVSGIREESSEISDSTRQIAQGNLDLSARTSEQAAALEETAAAMQEFAGNVNANALGARDASLLAETASGVAEQSGAALSQAVAAISGIQSVSGRIAEITEVMDQLAMQTHILALNAAVEAARAGEAGRGFTIVASEVQSLARSSREASRQIRALVADSEAIISSGTQLIGDAETMMDKLLEGVREVAHTVGAIAKASDQQASGIQQVNRAVAQMDEVTQNNAALVEQAAAATNAVQQRAHALVNSVGFFKLNGAPACA